MNIHNILCFGDSVTHGEQDNICSGWVERLKLDYYHQLEQSSTAHDLTSNVFKVYNLGIGSDTTDGLVARFETEFNARVFSKSQCSVILAYGLNDLVIHKNKNKVPLSIFTRHLTQCIAFAAARNARIGLMSLLPIPPVLDGKVNVHGHLRFNDDAVAYNQALKTIANQNNARYIDCYSAFIAHNTTDLYCRDWVHPNADGHKLIHQQVRHFLKDDDALA